MDTIIKWVVRYFSYASIIFTAIFLYIASILTNTGFFIVISSFLFGIAIVIPILSYLNLKNITISRNIYPLYTSGETLNISYTLKNLGSYPTFFILIKDEIKNYCADKEILSAELKILPPKAEKTINAEFIAKKRGLHELNQIEIQSYFPFMFYFFEKKIKTNDKITILPQQPVYKQIPYLSKYQSDKNSKFRSMTAEAEFVGLREHVPSDGLRLVHWPKSAAKGKLLVKEFSSERMNKTAIMIDGDKYSLLGKDDEIPFEDMITAGAGIIGYCSRAKIKANIIFEQNLKNGTGDELLQILAELKPEEIKDNLPIKSIKKAGISTLFLFTANPEKISKISKICFKERINLVISLFNASSYAKMKKNEYEYYSKTINDNKEQFFIYSKNQNLKLLFTKQ